MDSCGYSVWLLRWILCHSCISLLHLPCSLLCSLSLECPRLVTSNFSHLFALICWATSTVLKAEKLPWVVQSNLTAWHLHRYIQCAPQHGISFPWSFLPQLHLWFWTSSWQRFCVILTSHFISCWMSNSVSSHFLSPSIHPLIHHLYLFTHPSIYHLSDKTLYQYHRISETPFHLHFISTLWLTIASTMPHVNRANCWLRWSVHLKKTLWDSSSPHTFVHF